MLRGWKARIFYIWDDKGGLGFMAVETIKGKRRKVRLKRRSGFTLI